MARSAEGDAPVSEWYPSAGEQADWPAWANALSFCRDIGMTCLQLDRSAAVFQMQQSMLTPNPNGAVNGGVVAAAADQVMGAMALRTSEHGRLPATASLHLQFYRPAMAPLTFRATLPRDGRRTKFVDVVIEDRHGDRCASGQATMIVGGSGQAGSASVNGTSPFPSAG